MQPSCYVFRGDAKISPTPWPNPLSCPHDRDIRTAGRRAGVCGNRCRVLAGAEESSERARPAASFDEIACNMGGIGRTMRTKGTNERQSRETLRRLL